MCHKRLGVPRDNLQAYIWATIATANSKGINCKRAAEMRDKLLRKLTSKQKKRRRSCYRNGIRPAAEKGFRKIGFFLSIPTRSRTVRE
jgi:hypothetical protein